MKISPQDSAAKASNWAAVNTIAAAWLNLPGTVKTQFHALTLRLHPAPDGALPPGVNAFNTYASLCRARWYLGQMPLDTCPLPETAPALPALTLAGTWTPHAGLSVTVAADDPYPLAVLVWGIKPILGGTQPPPSARYGFVGFVPAARLGPAPFEMGTLYKSRFWAATAGYRLPLKFVGVTANGFLSVEQFAWVDVENA